MESTTKKVALVTGASRGIGRAIALELAAQGHQVIVNYKSNQEAAESVQRQIQQTDGICHLYPFDIADNEATDKAIKELLEQFGRVDILVNNAGIYNDAVFARMDFDTWYSVMNTNLMSFYHVTRPIVKKMMLNRFGRIITISSTSGLAGVPGQVNYSAAKAGVIGATKALARETASRNITVNAIAPGYIETDMLDGLNKEELIKSIPMRRLGTAEEVAGVVTFLCSSAAEYITGQVIAVNGGIF